MGKSLFHVYEYLPFLFVSFFSLSISYPSSFIDKHVRKFLYEYIPSTSFLPMLNDEQQFKRIRQHILGQPTPQQSQVAMSAASADLDNYPTNEQAIEKATNVLNNKQENKTTKADRNNIIVHYKHEKRFHSFKRDMHHMYDSTFQNQIGNGMKMIVGNRNRRDAKKELIHKRPKQYLLKNKAHKSKFSILTIDVNQTSTNNTFVFFIHLF